jgi:hypothetical protein
MPPIEFAGAVFAYLIDGTPLQLVTCSRCGAVVTQNSINLHRDWHAKLKGNGAECLVIEDNNEG